MDNLELKQIGERIADERKRLNLTQTELAIQCDLGLKTISLIENGRRKMQVETLVRLCKRFNVTADYLLFGLTYESDAKYIEEKLKQITREQAVSIKNLLDAFTTQRKM